MKKLHEVPKSEWPPQGKTPVKKVFKSGEFLVQIFNEKYATRLTVNKVKRRGHNWQDGITWDELQEIKRQVGFGEHFAVECYPEDKNVVNVANMRHLFIVERPPFAWEKS